MNKSEPGCAIVVAILLAAAVVIAGCPILAGITVGLILRFVVLPVIIWFFFKALDE
jgi:hypothetical protein